MQENSVESNNTVAGVVAFVPIRSRPPIAAPSWNMVAGKVSEDVSEGRPMTSRWDFVAIQFGSGLEIQCSAFFFSSK